MIFLVFNLLYVMLLEFLRSQLKHAFNRPLLKQESEWPSVTIVVPFRNERATLPSLIRLLQQQTYYGELPEIILVNDHSEDMEEGFQQLPDNFRLLHLGQGETGKKSALTAGIRAAQGKWIVTTDADTQLTKGWLTALLQSVEDSNVAMVCGAVEVRSEGDFLGDFQQMETRILQGAGIAMLGMDIPFLNTGTSLAFRRDAWEAVGGYNEHKDIASGDDVFLMFAMHRRFPGRVVAATLPAATVETNAVKSIGAFFRQRVRWTAKMKAYKSFPVLTVAALVLLAAAGVIFSVVTGDCTLLITLLVVRAFGELRLLNTVSRNKEVPGVFHRLWMVILYPFYLLILTLAVIVYKPSWKGR